MAHSLSAKKRIRQNEKRRLRNKTVKSRVKTQRKKVLAAVEKGDYEMAVRELHLAYQLLDKAASKGVLHQNTVARYKSRLARNVNTLAPRS
jgi:small subunit ribosomal protein S20